MELPLSRGCRNDRGYGPGPGPPASSDSCCRVQQTGRSYVTCIHLLGEPGVSKSVERQIARPGQVAQHPVGGQNDDQDGFGPMSPVRSKTGNTLSAESGRRYCPSGQSGCPLVQVDRRRSEDCAGTWMTCGGPVLCSTHRGTASQCLMQIPGRNPAKEFTARGGCEMELPRWVNPVKSECSSARGTRRRTVWDRSGVKPCRVRAWSGARIRMSYRG